MPHIEVFHLATEQWLGLKIANQRSRSGSRERSLRGSTPEAVFVTDLLIVFSYYS